MSYTLRATFLNLILNSSTSLAVYFPLSLPQILELTSGLVSTIRFVDGKWQQSI